MSFTQILFANNAGSALAAPITNSQTTITVTAGTGSEYPTPSGTQFFCVTVMSAGNAALNEVMHCTNVTGDVLTVIRAQDGTTAKAFNIYDPVANFWTAGQAQQILQAYIASDRIGGVSAVQPFAGNPNGSVAGNAVNGVVPPSMCWDSTESTLWICTTTGSTSTAVWVRNSTMQVYAGNPNGAIAGAAGTAGNASPSMVWDAVNSLIWVCTSTGSTSTAVWAAVGQSEGTINCGTSTGSANAQILTPTPALTSYSTGPALSWIAGFTNTGATTINVSGLGVKNIYKDSPTGPIPLTGGEIVAGNILTMRYDGTQFQLTATELGTASLANASSNTGTVAAAFSTFTAGNLVTAKDAAGTIQDSGIAVTTINGTSITVANSGQTLQPATYIVDTTGGAFSINLSSTLLGLYTFIDAANYWSTNNFTVNGNGKNIGGGITDALAIAGGASTFVSNVSNYEYSIEARQTLSYWRLV